MEIHDRQEFEWFRTIKADHYHIDLFTNEPLELQAQIELANQVFQPEIVEWILHHLTEEIIICEFDSDGCPIVERSEDGIDYRGEKLVEVVWSHKLEAAILGEDGILADAVYSYQIQKEKQQLQEAA